MDEEILDNFMKQLRSSPKANRDAIKTEVKEKAIASYVYIKLMLILADLEMGYISLMKIPNLTSDIIINSLESAAAELNKKKEDPFTKQDIDKVAKELLKELEKDKGDPN